MTCAVLTIGTELTRGELVNGNAAWLSERLTELGFEVGEHLVIPDDRTRVVGALKRMAAGFELVVVTGGLGPTTDDLTTECAATALGVGLVRDEASLAHMRARFTRLGRPWRKRGAPRPRARDDEARREALQTVHRVGARAPRGDDGRPVLPPARSPSGVGTCHWHP